MSEPPFGSKPPKLLAAALTVLASGRAAPPGGARPMAGKITTVVPDVR